MTSVASPSAVRAAGPGTDARAAQLRAANINPRTGLATDYLNHFNEAVMLLEMIPDIPECAEDFLAWRPLSYAEHFMASNFKARDLAIETYDSADTKTRATLAEEATGWVKPLVTLAGGIINGGVEADIETIMAG